MFQLLTIRYFQLKRDLGVLFFVIIILITYLSYTVFTHPKQIGVYYALLLLYLLHSFHRNRKDKTFVILHLNKPQQQFLLEYQLALLPFSLGSLLSEQWFCFFIIHFLGLTIIMFGSQKLHFSHKYLFLTQWFKHNFIFISGLRQNLIAFVLLVIVALVLSPLKLFPLVALFLVNQIIMNFHNTNEGFQLLKAKNLTAKVFLKSILLKQLGLLLIINSPVVIINSLFNADMFLFNLYFLGYNALMLAATICIKYENYKPNKQLRMPILKQALMLFGLFIPFLAIITAIYFIQTRADSIKNLNHYLDDTD